MHNIWWRCLLAPSYESIIIYYYIIIYGNLKRLCPSIKKIFIDSHSSCVHHSINVKSEAPSCPPVRLRCGAVVAAAWRFSPSAEYLEGWILTVTVRKLKWRYFPESVRYVLGEESIKRLLSKVLRKCTGKMENVRGYYSFICIILSSATVWMLSNTWFQRSRF